MPGYTPAKRAPVEPDGWGFAQRTMGYGTVVEIIQQKARVDRSSLFVRLGWLGGFAAATALVAWIGSLITAETVDSAWFEQLDKPGFYPPAATFGIVWTGLYIMIAVAAWLAWRAGGGTETTVPWVIQLVLNLGWSVLFFGTQRPGWALVEIVVLLAAAIWTAIAFHRYDKWAMILFIPYIMWICFAAILNGAIVSLN